MGRVSRPAVGLAVFEGSGPALFATFSVETAGALGASTGTCSLPDDFAIPRRKILPDSVILHYSLRDTFAVNLLIAGVAIEDVSTLLGHSSVLTTERYYAPWDISRRDHLARIVRSANAEGHLLDHLYGPATVVNQGDVAAGCSDFGRASSRVGRTEGDERDTEYSSGWR